MTRILVFFLAFILIALPAVQAQSVPDARVEKARQDATKLADSKTKAEVITKIGSKWKGLITSVEQDSFNFVEDKTNQTKTFAFSDVDKIQKHRRITTAGWIGIGAGAAAAVVIIALCPIYSWKCR